LYRLREAYGSCWPGLDLLHPPDVMHIQENTAKRLFGLILDKTDKKKKSTKNNLETKADNQLSPPKKYFNLYGEEVKLSSFRLTSQEINEVHRRIESIPSIPGLLHKTQTPNHNAFFILTNRVSETPKSS
jgi:hypothetical protein